MLALAIASTATAIIIHAKQARIRAALHPAERGCREHLGVNTYAYKTAAFSLSAVFVGIAGAIYASWVNYIEPPDVFDVLLVVKPLVMVLLGGLGTIFGPALGAVILLTFEELVWRNFLTIHAAALGLIIVVLVLFSAQRHSVADPRAISSQRAREMTALLTLDGVSRRFGGLNAVDGVSLID